MQSSVLHLDNLHGMYAVFTKNDELIHVEKTSYCSAPLDYPLARRPLPATALDAGDGVVADGLELRQLQVTIRHGDRSAIHDLPNAYENKWKCQPLSEEIRRKWEGVSR